MKKIMIITFVLVSSIVILVFEVFSNSHEKTYNISDFNEIIMYESNLDDVLSIAPETVFYHVGKGVSCRILLDDGKKLYIEFYGPEMKITKMEEIE